MTNGLLVDEKGLDQNDSARAQAMSHGLEQGPLQVADVDDGVIHGDRQRVGGEIGLNEADVEALGAGGGLDVAQSRSSDVDGVDTMAAPGEEEGIAPSCGRDLLDTAVQSMRPFAQEKGGRQLWATQIRVTRLPFIAIARHGSS